MNEFIRIGDPEALRMLKHLANEDMRTIGREVAWLIRSEYARRYSQPNPAITIADAKSAESEVTSEGTGET